MGTTLSAREGQQLGELEQQVDDLFTRLHKQAGRLLGNRQEVIETSQAIDASLLKIRDGKLFRGHGTWEDYCRSRWSSKISKRHANRLKVFAELQEQVGPIGPKLLESHCRVLVKVAPEARPALLEQAAVQGEITADSLSDLISQAHPDLASLPPEEQLAVLRANEEEVMSRASQSRGGKSSEDGEAARRAQIGRLLRRLRKLIKGLPDEAEAGLAWLGECPEGLVA